MNTTFDLIVFTDYFPYGNTETFLSEELLFLSMAFNNVLIVPLSKSKDLIMRDIPDNFTIYSPPFINLKSKSNFIWKGIANSSPIIRFIRHGIHHKIWKSIPIFRNWITSLFLTRILTSYFNKLIKEKNINNTTLLYFYWGLRWSQVIPFLPENFANIVIRMHGSDLYEELNNNYIPFRHEQLLRVKGAFLISQMGVNYFLRKYPIMAEKAFLSRLGSKNYGINPPKIKLDCYYIVSCSSLIPLKRVHLIAESLKLVKKHIIWNHFGSGSEKNMILRIIDKSENQINAEISEWISHEDLMKFYLTHHVDAFINVSSSEGIPVSVIEALSFGIPVIATDVGGTSEIVDSSCGKIIPSEINPEMLANTIDNFLSVSDLKFLRQNARIKWQNTCNSSKLYPVFINTLKQLSKHTCSVGHMVI